MNHLWFLVTLALIVAHRITLLTTLFLKPQTLRLPSISLGHQFVVASGFAGGFRHVTFKVSVRYAIGTSSLVARR